MIQILYRDELGSKYEHRFAKQYFDVRTLRSECVDSIVIGRYSVLPYYRELENDLKNNGSFLINNYAEHSWIANFDYYDAVKEYTFESWNDDNFYTCDYPGPFVVKGKTTSKKLNWNNKMFASDKRKAIHIAAELCNDSLIGEQGIIYRKYIPLKRFGSGMNQLPFTNEWRLFYLQSTLLSFGYYWSIADYWPDSSELPQEAIDFANEVAKIVAKHATFFVLDIAEKADGGWILVEINDAQMSGLSENDPNVLYNNLLECLLKTSSQLLFPID